ncbi:MULTISPECIES: LysR family transcriptional regulator [Rhodopseudomonas]|uniref:LysR family transcriptional regulator n=1 Tax=Rhodopseudomonas TaxID=1073 RepID=UPI0005CB20CA|nr:MULTISPECIES: LysR family transcriptional regulator [Rhodopseudomonas]MDF3811925.1 LysR substrate-binding domain-containing protein [Rhodopseudomonas sp. BAL398]WOK16686.1 LysR substrate-binding domain-containing protein [Rhodopseudomonas sp. BAL398]
MPDVVLDLRHLKYAMVAAEQGSFRRAAEFLNLSQATVSRRIQLLERRLGVSLFERSRTGSRLTQAGEIFIRDAEVGAAHFRQAVTNLGLARQGQTGKIRIGLMASLARGFLGELFSTFRASFPNIDVTFEEASSQSNAAGVLNGRLDAAFISGRPELPGCHTRMLWQERIFLAMPVSHQLAGVKNVRLNLVRDETFLVGADGPGPEIEDYLVRQLSVLGFRPKIVAQKVGRENLLNMVAGGYGLTLTTYSTLGVAYPGLSFVPVGEPEENVISSVVWPANSKNPALIKLLDICYILSRKYQEIDGFALSP